MPNFSSQFAPPNPTVITSAPARKLMGDARQALDEGIMVTGMQQQKIQAQQAANFQQSQQDFQRKQEFDQKQQMEQLKASLANG